MTSKQELRERIASLSTARDAYRRHLRGVRAERDEAIKDWDEAIRERDEARARVAELEAAVTTPGLRCDYTSPEFCDTRDEAATAPEPRPFRVGDRVRVAEGAGAVPTWRHRERVRFGAWESADRARVREHVCCERVGKGRHPCILWTRHHGPHRAWEPPKPCACCQIPRAIPDEATRAAVGRSGPGTGGSEGPQISGPENTYKCEPAEGSSGLGGDEGGE